jgi:hypothetical protein
MLLIVTVISYDAEQLRPWTSMESGTARCRPLGVGERSHYGSLLGPQNQQRAGRDPLHGIQECAKGVAIS